MNEVILILTLMAGDIKGPQLTQWYPDMEACKVAAEGTHAYVNKSLADEISLKKQCVKKASKL